MNKKKNQWKAWLYLLPALVVLGIFTVWPIINTIRMGFLEGYNSAGERLGQPFSFGFANFSNVVGYREFTTCLGNTLLLTVVTVPISTMLALLIAVIACTCLGIVIEGLAYRPLREASSLAVLITAIPMSPTASRSAWSLWRCSA